MAKTEYFLCSIIVWNYQKFPTLINLYAGTTGSLLVFKGLATLIYLWPTPPLEPEGSLLIFNVSHILSDVIAALLIFIFIPPNELMLPLHFEQIYLQFHDLHQPLLITADYSGPSRDLMCNCKLRPSDIHWVILLPPGFGPEGETSTSSIRILGWSDAILWVFALILSPKGPF